MSLTFEIGQLSASISGLHASVACAESAGYSVVAYAKCAAVTAGDALVISMQAARLERLAAELRKAAGKTSATPFLQAAE